MLSDWASVKAREIIRGRTDPYYPSLEREVAAALRAERRLHGEEAQQYGWVGDESPVQFMGKLLRAERARAEKLEQRVRRYEEEKRERYKKESAGAN